MANRCSFALGAVHYLLDMYIQLVQFICPYVKFNTGSVFLGK